MFTGFIGTKVPCFEFQYAVAVCYLLWFMPWRPVIVNLVVVHTTYIYQNSGIMVWCTVRIEKYLASRYFQSISQLLLCTMRCICMLTTPVTGSNFGGALQQNSPRVKCDRICVPGPTYYSNRVPSLIFLCVSFLSTAGWRSSAEPFNGRLNNNNRNAYPTPPAYVFT